MLLRTAYTLYFAAKFQIDGHTKIKKMNSLYCKFCTIHELSEKFILRNHGKGRILASKVTHTA